MNILRRFIKEAFQNPAYEKYRETLAARKAAEQRHSTGQQQQDPQKITAFYKAIDVISALMNVNDARRKTIWDNILSLSSDRFFYLKNYLSDPYRNKERIKKMLLPDEY